MGKFIKKWETRGDWDEEIFDSESNFLDFLFDRKYGITTCKFDLEEEEDLVNTYVCKHNEMPQEYIQFLVESCDDDILDDLKYNRKKKARCGSIFFEINDTVYYFDVCEREGELDFTLNHCEYFTSKRRSNKKILSGLKRFFLNDLTALKNKAPNIFTEDVLKPLQDRIASITVHDIDTIKLPDFLEADEIVYVKLGD